MAYNPDMHHRHSIRKANFDYTQAGAYFVTVCTQHRHCVLDDPVIAGICCDVWLALPGWFPTLGLDDFTIMPNHTHFVLWLVVKPVDGQGAMPVMGAPVSAPLAPQLQIYGYTNGVRPPNAGWVIPTPLTTKTRPHLGEVIGAWKSLVTTVYLDWIKRKDPTRCAKVWQRNYYEHIIRNDRALLAIRQYVRDNPKQWRDDPDNPANHLGLPYPGTVEDYIKDIQRYT